MCSLSLCPVAHSDQKVDALADSREQVEESMGLVQRLQQEVSV